MTNTFGVVVVPEYNERMITEFKCGNTFRFVVDNSCTPSQCSCRLPTECMDILQRQRCRSNDRSPRYFLMIWPPPTRTPRVIRFRTNNRFCDSMRRQTDCSLVCDLCGRWTGSTERSRFDPVDPQSHCAAHGADR